MSSTIAPTPGGPRLGAEIPGTHLFYTIDAGAAARGPTSSTSTASATSAYTKLFPNLELGRVRAFLQLIKQNPVGRVPQQMLPQHRSVHQRDVGHPEAAHADAPPIFGAPPPAPSTDLGALFEPTGGDSFRDTPHKVIYRDLRPVPRDRRREPRVLRVCADAEGAAAHAVLPPGRLAPPADPPSNNPPNTYDQIVVDGHGIYNSQLYLLSLQILSTLTPKARQARGPRGHTAVQKELDTELAAAKAEFEEIFWNPEHRALPLLRRHRRHRRTDRRHLRQQEAGARRRTSSSSTRSTPSASHPSSGYRT